MQAQEHRKAQAKKSVSSGPRHGGQKDIPGRQPKIFNLWTYKFHSLRDYVSTIRRYGITDSYTTSLVSLLPLPFLFCHESYCRVSLNIANPKRDIKGPAKKILFRSWLKLSVKKVESGVFCRRPRQSFDPKIYQIISNSIITLVL